MSARGEEYAARRAQVRRERARRLARRVQQPVRRESLRDPLRRLGLPWARWLALGAAAAAIHVLIGGIFVGVSAAVYQPPSRPMDDVPVEIRIVEPPDPEPEPESELEPEPEPETKPKEVPPRRKPKPAPEEPPAPTPSPDPTEAPEPPPPKKPPPRRMVGLNMESTVSSGEGPRFSVGNTRMGATDRTANDPDAAEPLSQPEPTQAGRNQRATRLAAIGASGPGKGGFVPPKFVRKLKPPYPEIYRSQGLEDDVTVKVDIDERGRVTKAVVVASSQYDDFNRAALATAKKQQFEPAMRDGQPIPWSITYAYRFFLPE